MWPRSKTFCWFVYLTHMTDIYIYNLFNRFSNLIMWNQQQNKSYVLNLHDCSCSIVGLNNVYKYFFKHLKKKNEIRNVYKWLRKLYKICFTIFWLLSVRILWGYLPLIFFNIIYCVKILLNINQSGEWLVRSQCWNIFFLFLLNKDPIHCYN